MCRHSSLLSLADRGDIASGRARRNYLISLHSKANAKEFAHILVRGNLSSLYISRDMSLLSICKAALLELAAVKAGLTYFFM